MSKSKILIVDDENMNIKLLKGILFSENYTFYEAMSGEESLSMVKDVKPDLILLDVMMPGMSGFEVCQKIKQDENTKSIPIIMVTALNEKEHRIKAMESGADDFLGKPVDSTEVLIRVKSLLRVKFHYDEILRKNKEIAVKNRKLVELEKFKDGLIHMIVHDLRNPLWAVFGYLDLLLLDKSRFDQNQINYLESGIDSCQELKEMIDSLLDIYKMEEGQMKLNIVKADIKELIEESIQSFSVKATTKQIGFSFDCSDGKLAIPIDRSLVKRVFSNLINNAIRHTPSGGEIKILAGPFQNNGNLLVEVKDTGNGIEPAFHETVFDKFEQVIQKQSGNSVGASGLGLSFCKLAVEAHGGRIWVESEGQGKGANFQFTLPAKQPV